MRHFVTVLLSVFFLLIPSYYAVSSDKIVDKKISTNNREKLNKKELKEILEVLEKNDHLHTSFYDYNGEAVVKNAKLVVASISRLSNKKIKSMLQFSNNKLKLIKKENPREVNDDIYNLFSMALIYIVNHYDVGKYNAFSCPMVKKKWIQNSKKLKGVHNPYDPNMKRCGSKDTRY